MLKLKGIRNVENLKFEAEGTMEIQGVTVQIKSTGHFPLMTCAEAPESAARSVAAEMYARHSDRLRREFIHNLEMGLREVIRKTVPCPVTRGVTAELTQKGSELHIELRRDVNDGE